MKNILRLLGLLILILFFISCKENSNEPETKVNLPKIEEAFAQAGQMSNIKSLVVFQDGKVVKESYWNNSSADSRHDVRSVTKSVISILIGIAVEKGIIKSIDQPISEYASNYGIEIPQDKKGITVRHLLTMTAGFKWNELTNVSGYNDWFSSSNQVKYLLDTPLQYNPGEMFTYNSAAIHFLSVILSGAAETSTLKFAQQNLFDPLEIEEPVWQMDKQGFYNGGAGLQITPNDMIKIGELILNRGVYKGKRIVSDNWIDQSTQSKIDTGITMSFSSGYGFCWWTGQTDSVNYVFANGWGGQFIVIVPSLKLVVVATNKWSGVGTTTANSQWYSTMRLIIIQIITSFQ